MATLITLVDDIDGKTKLPADSTSTIIFVKDARLPNGGFHVEIDLSAKNLNALGEATKVYADNGREVTETVPATKNGKDSNSDGPVIRAWAQANPDLLPEGVKVPGDRGALSKDVIAAYDVHHASEHSEAPEDTADATDVSTDV